jgi:lipopolysaccharide export system protein LptC
MWERWLRRGLLALSAVLASSLAYLLLTRSESVSTPQVAPPSSFESADGTIQGFTFRQTKSGALQWEVHAKHARLFQGENRAVLDDVQVTLYGETGKQLSLHGDEGTLDMAKKDFLLSNRRDPIVVVTGDGYTIYTNHIAWSENEHEIRTNEPVVIKGQGVEINGRGLLGKLDTEVFQVLDNVQVDIAPST